MSRGGGREVPLIGDRRDGESYGFERLTLPELREMWKAERDSSAERSRADFVRLTALRAELFSRLRAPASVRKWGKEAS